MLQKVVSFCLCLKFRSVVDTVSYRLLEGGGVLFVFKVHFSSVDTVSYSLLEGGGVLFVFKVQFS